jgi:hypothetical protein
MLTKRVVTLDSTKTPAFFWKAGVFVGAAQLEVAWQIDSV